MQNRLKETKSQERLINLMLQAGLEWPEGEQYAVQGMKTGMILFSVVKPQWEKGKGWRVNTFSTTVNVNSDVIRNAHQTIITREQYEARDGWITWHGGECPVDRHVVVDVTYRDGEVGIGLKAVSYRWHGGSSDSDIIAYRIHKQAAAEPCESVNACIPYQPTIGQLIAEWEQAKQHQDDELHNLNKQQAVYDAARAVTDAAHKRVQDKLAELGWQAEEQSKPEQPTITDWRDLRVGDVVYFSESTEDGVTDFGECKIIGADYGSESQPFYVEFTSGFGTWPNLKYRDWKFIRRP